MKIIIAYSLLIFGLGVNYIFNVVVARYLGATNFGDFSYAIYLFNIFSLIAVFSLDQAAIRFISQANQPKDIRINIQFLAVVSGFIFSILFCVTIFLFVEGNRANLAYLFSLSVVPFVMLTVNAAILQSEHIVGPRMVFRYVVEPVVKIITFLILFRIFYSNTAPVIALLIALITANFFAVVVHKKRLFYFGVKVSITRLINLLKFVVPMSAGNALSVLSGRLDVLILGVLVAASDLGRYSAAFQTAGVITIVLQGIETVYAPIFSSHIGKSNYIALKEDYQKALRWVMLISCPLILNFVVYPELLISPFGVEYKGAASILAVLCIGQFFNIALGSANTILIMLGRTKLVLFISLLYVLLTAVFVSVGANYKNVIGAAMGAVCAIAVTNAVRVFFVYRLTGCHPFSSHYLKIFLTFILSIFIGYLCKSYLLNYGVLLYPIMFFAITAAFGLHGEDKKIITKIYFMLIKKK